MRNRSIVTWIALLVGEACLAALAVGAFWWQDWRYSLPTPRPVALKQTAIGERMELPKAVGMAARPTLLHFFNPNCPCSRFNLDHVRDLITKYAGQVRVVAVLENADAAAAKQAFERLDLDCEVVPDPQGEIAALAGVYSTPQGVVLDEQGLLYYRGNYNRGLAQLPPPHFPNDATIALGCELPANQLPSLLGETNRP
jgi:hypothetical protein